MLRKRQQASERAQRFPIHIPIRYRTPRSPDWFVACTENVSRSGVVFRTERVFAPATTLDIRLELPPTDHNDGVRGEIVCKGEVVRVDQSDDGGIPQTVAVAIRQYRLTQKRQPN
jgi:hypothetical protein